MYSSAEVRLSVMDKRHIASQQCKGQGESKLVSFKSPQFFLEQGRGPWVSKSGPWRKGHAEGEGRGGEGCGEVGGGEMEAGFAV